MYAHKCVCTCGPIYVYTWYLMASSDACVTSMMSLAVVHMPRRAGSLSWARSPENPLGLWFPDTYKCREIDPCAFDGEMSSSAPHHLHSGSSSHRTAVKTVPPLWTCLDGGWRRSSVLCPSAGLDAEALEGSAALASTPSVLNLSGKGDNI